MGTLFARGALAFFAVTLSFSIHGQTYPAKPVRFVVPFVPGGPTDIQGRMLGEKLGQRLGQQVIVDNRGGAGGNIGMELTAKSPPDGYTIVIATVGTWAVNPYLYQLPYDVVEGFRAHYPGLHLPRRAGRAPVGAGKEREGADRAREEAAGRAELRLFGRGRLRPHLRRAVRPDDGDEDDPHPVQELGALADGSHGGKYPGSVQQLISTTPFVKTGRVRALATTGAKRSPALPDLPTLDEAGLKGYENSSWSAVAAPAGTPPAIISRLNKEFIEILRMPDIQKRHAEVGAEIIASTPEQFHAYLKSELAKFSKLVKAAGIKAATGG